MKFWLVSSIVQLLSRVFPKQKLVRALTQLVVIQLATVILHLLIKKTVRMPQTSNIKAALLGHKHGVGEDGVPLVSYRLQKSTLAMRCFDGWSPISSPKGNSGGKERHLFKSWVDRKSVTVTNPLLVNSLISFQYEVIWSEDINYTPQKVIVSSWSSWRMQIRSKLLYHPLISTNGDQVWRYSWPIWEPLTHRTLT